MSLRRILGAVAALSVVGLSISVYLTSIYLSGGVALCLGSGGCSTVQASPFAWILGIPIPTLGAAAYVLVILLSLLALRDSERQEAVLLALFGFALVGLLFSAYLTILELFVIHAICLWCVASAVVMVAVFALTAMAWRRFSQQHSG